MLEIASKVLYSCWNSSADCMSAHIVRVAVEDLYAPVQAAALKEDP